MELANSTLAILAALSAVRTDLSGMKAEVRGLIKDVMEEERGIIRQEMVELEKLRAQTREGLDLLAEMRQQLRLEQQWLSQQQLELAGQLNRARYIMGVDTWSAIRSPQAAIFILTWSWKAGGWLRGAGIVIGFICDWSTTIFISIGYILFSIWTWASSSWLGRRLLGTASASSASASASTYGSISTTPASSSGNSSWWSWVTGWWSTPEVVTSSGINEAVTTMVEGSAPYDDDDDNGEFMDCTDNERGPLLPA